MAAAHESVAYDVHDCKVYPLTSDSGASPTYGAAIDVYGIAEVSLDPNLVTAELKGDAKIIAKKGRVDRFNVKAKYGRLSMDVLTALIGGTTTDVSATQARFRQVGATTMPYFAIAALLKDLDNGLASMHMIVYKAQITGGTFLSQATDQFGQPTFDCEGIPLDCPGGGWTAVMADLNYYTVDTALPTTLP